MKRLLIHLNDIHKSNSKCYLKNINLSIYEEDVLGIVGLNGSGKSMLLDIIRNIEKQDNGEIKYYNGISNIKQQVRVIDNKSQLISQMSIAENLVILTEKPRMNILYKKKLYEYANNIVEFCDMEIDVRVAVQKLTLFQQILLKIAKAYDNGVKILILRDICHTCTTQESDQLFKIVRKLTSKKISVIFVENRINDVMQKMDRLIVLEKGQIVRILYKGEYTKKYANLLLLNTHKRLYSEKIVLKEDTIKPPTEWIINLHIAKKKMEIPIPKGKIIGLIDMHSTDATIFFNSDESNKSSVCYKGKTFLLNNYAKLIENNISFFPEDINKMLFSDLNAIENIVITKYHKMCKIPNMLNTKLLKYALKNQLSKGEITDFQIPVSGLKHEEKIKIVVERLLFEKSKLIIMQSPTYMYDVVDMKIIDDFILNLVHIGGSVLLLAKNPQTLRKTCDHIYTIK